MSETELLYLDDSELLEANASVVEITETENDTMLLLDQTIFYPQGGGQPYDQGTISNEQGRFSVTSVRFQDGQVQHYGSFEKGNFEAGDAVTLQVEADRRKLLSRIHSAGHLLDVAVFNCGFGFPPTKGYHFPDSPYVEYDGTIPPEEREEVKGKIEQELNRLVETGETVVTQVVGSKQELANYCKFVPDYIPEGKPIRVVTIAQNFGCPCGGTHVKQVSEIGQVSVAKIKVKSGKTRISYKLADQ